MGGYSNGGECALSFGAKHPDVFGSIVDISGEIGTSLGSVATTIRVGFAGNQEAYTAEQPLTIMKSHHYDDTLAVFTDGSNDPYYGPEGATAEAAARAAGMTTAASSDRESGTEPTPSSTDRPWHYRCSTRNGDWKPQSPIQPA